MQNEEGRKLKERKGLILGLCDAAVSVLCLVAAVLELFVNNARGKDMEGSRPFISQCLHCAGVVKVNHEKYVLVSRWLDRNWRNRR